MHDCRFKEGLSCLGVLTEIQRNLEKMLPMFVEQNTNKIDAATMDFIFTPTFSDHGSNRYHQELRNHGHWRDLLQDLEGKY